MVNGSEIQRLADSIARRFHPERVLLFGSYANGTPTDDSDVDLLVVLDHDGRGAKQAAAIRMACHRGFPLDLIVYTPTRLRERLAMGDCFLREVVEKGKPLYEADHVRVG